jgi:hypothetical protein
MKNLFAAALLMLATALPVQAAEIFGIEMGSPAAQYKLSTEPLAVQGKMSMYKVDPPKPDEAFPGYALTAYEGRVVRITAFSKADYSKDGANTKKRFAAVVERMTQRFGSPALFDEALAEDSKLTAPDQWRQSLLDRERIVQSLWVMPNVVSPDQLESVWLEANAIPLDPEAASFLTFSARVRDFPLYEKKAALEANETPQR